MIRIWKMNMAWSLVKVEQNKSNIVALCVRVCVGLLRQQREAPGLESANNYDPTLRSV